VAESVEIATILLTDLVGSTRLATSVGPVRADELREEHFGLLRDAIGACECREVKNTGDGLMVAFASASAAVKCAVSMQQLFERRYRKAEQGLHVRIGLGAGESTIKDGDYFGMPSIEAARLCAQASTDGILISALTKTLAGRCEGVEFASAGELELKGFPEPVEAFSVSWAPLGEEASGAGDWPLPAVLRSVPPVSYVGRVEERAALEEAVNLTRSGQRQMVLLSGEPGIGKTRLASYAAHHAYSDGFAVCWGTCSEELAVPYEPWIGISAHVVEHAPQELLERHAKRHGGELVRLARGLRERIPDLPEPQTSDPETERYLLFSAVAGLLGEVAEDVPLCVVLDDLHLADAQSLALLKHLLRTLEQGALQVIATFRDSELGKDHPLMSVLADLRSMQGVQRVALQGLGADEVAEIISAVAGHELDRDGLRLAAEIAQETDGNPFFVAEILRGLSESGALVFDEDAGRWSVDRSVGIALPESVREVIERRVERLGEETLEALRIAAVIGRTFDLELLSTIVDANESALLDRLEAAVAASVLAESSEQVGRFRFAHALISQTLYEGIGATRRARLHQRVAQALDDLYGADPRDHLAELALHWRLAAVSVDKAKAADYALKAGQQALQNLAPSEALKLFSDAIELTNEGSGERCEALIGLGVAQRETGDGAYRETLLEASRIASTLRDAELAASAALANSRGWFSMIGGIDEERIDAIERALQLDDPPDAARRARLLALEALERHYDPDFARRKALADEALALARSAGDARTLAEVLLRASYAYWTAETLEQRAAFVREFVECAETLRDPVLDYWVHYLTFVIQVEAGEFERARDALERAQLAAEELGQPGVKWLATFSRAAWELMHGDLAGGERLVELAFQIGREAGEPDAIIMYGVQLNLLRLYQGRGEELLASLEKSVGTSAIAGWKAALPQLMAWTGRGPESRAILERGASVRFAEVPWQQSRSTALAFYADAAVQTGNSSAASILYELIEPWAGQTVWNGAAGYGHARMYLGLLAAVLERHDEADEHLQFACEFHETNGLLLWAARTHLGWAEALAARGEVARAREHASRALDLSREHGYGLFEPRAAALVETESAAGA
jgi:class 3 adenylate cyclase